MKVNLLSKIRPATSVVKTALAGDRVIVVAGIAAVIAGTTTATVLKDVYDVHWRHHKKKKVPADSVPNPEDGDDVESDFTDALGDDIDPSDNI